VPDRLDKLREEYDRAFGKLMDVHLAALNRVSLAYLHDLLTEAQYEVQFKEIAAANKQQVQELTEALMQNTSRIILEEHRSKALPDH
jgi:hypothetical protein